jgi:superfamily II RNA helicase
MMELSNATPLDATQAPERYKGLVLDGFQRQAIAAIQRDASVLVSAPTGTGKTLIADFLVERTLAAGQRVIYTAPIKALSNQKFEEYRERLGEDKVGLLTGDVSVHPEAPLCIMTTEVLRNQLIVGDGQMGGLAWVVFDEIHYISSDRGIAWEESIILLPHDVHILGLSATVANLDDLAAWIAETTGQRVERVSETRRAVPLSLRYVTPAGTGAFGEARRWSEQAESGGQRLHHLELVQALMDARALPALYFVFSRAGTEQRAIEAAARHQFLDRGQARAMEAQLAELSRRYPGAREVAGALGRCLRQGVGFHHAGLLPATKRVVEILYGQGLIPLLYCTETFAVGVNYPVRGVALESSRKFDGTRFRPLTAQEFQQMTGRAGRRGKDRQGLAFLGVDATQRGPLVDYARLPLEPVESQFFVTESTVLNLLRTFGKERALDVLGRNFREFARRRREHAGQIAKEALLAERDRLWAQGCPNLCTAACPLERRRLRTEQADLRRRRRHRHNRQARLAVDRRLEAVAEALATEENCPKTPDPCRPLVAPFKALRERLDLAEQGGEAGDVRARYRAEMDRVCELLERLGYIEGETLLGRGRIARHLHVEPLLLTELLFDGFFHRESPETVGAVLAGVDYDARHDDTCYGLPPVTGARDVERLARRLRAQGAQVGFDPVVCPLVGAWADGEPFAELMAKTTISEGDFIGAVRRSLDLLRQLRSAVREDPVLVERLEAASAALDRAEARVVF